MAYFSHFPNIFYRGHVTKNIVARAAVPPEIFKDVSVFYPYELKEGDRPDIASERIYRSPFYDWAIYLTNNIVDPYYDWYMSQRQFEQHIERKYGSVEAAKRTTMFYRVNWLQDDSNLTPSGFEQLPVVLKKYWEAVYDELTGSVIKYKRRQLDVTQNTNKIVQLDVVYLNDKSFAVGEQVQQTSGGSVTATAFVVWAGTDSVIIQHTAGDFTEGSTFEGYDTSTQCRITSVATLMENISSTEAAYWSPISYYEYEEENNEDKRTIQLLAPRYITIAQDQFKQLISE